MLAREEVFNPPILMPNGDVNPLIGEALDDVPPGQLDPSIIRLIGHFQTKTRHFRVGEPADRAG